ncbi:atlastin [Ditylenchus destructor]|nr:atlastin [Ditylenchus destructor]
MKSAVQIVKIEIDQSTGRSRFILNKPVLESVLNVHKDRKIVVVSVAGAFRQGKSFLLNIFLRYLRLASTGSTPENGWLKRGGPLQGFESRNGHGGCTKGIWAYPDLFVFTLNDSSEVAVMLVDCQGVFDNHANPEECAMVFTFSVLMSSVQIYNVNGRIQRDNLENLQLFVAYGKLAAEDQGKETDFKPFQKLMFTVRDFANPEEFAYGQEGGKKYLLKELSSHGQSSQLKDVKEFVWDTFENVECCLMPHPGQSVALGRSDYMSKMEDEFAEHAERLTESLLHPDVLVPKRVAGKEITGSNLIDLIESYAKVLDYGNCIDANTILQIKANFSNNELQKELFTEYTNLMTESLESNPWAHAQSKHEAIKAAVFNKFDLAKKLGGDVMAAKHRDELETNIEAAYNSFVNQNNSRTEKIQAKKAAENNEKKRREAERTVEQAKMEKGYSEAVLKEERDRMRQEERRRKDDMKEQTEMLEKMAKQYDERVNRHLAAQEARAGQIRKEQREMQEAAERRHQEQMHAMRDSYRELSDVKGMAKLSHNLSNIVSAMISGSSKSETAQDSTIKCVICEAPKEEVKIGNHYGCNNSCITCRKFFESSVKNMTKSSHKFLGGKNATRHCYNNFGCDVKGKRPCTSCRFLKCIDNHMNPELPLRSAAREVQENAPENQNRCLDDYTKELRATYESNLDILLSAAHEARANSKIEPAMISGPANNCEESSEYSKPLCVFA